MHFRLRQLSLIIGCCLMSLNAAQAAKPKATEGQADVSEAVLAHNFSTVGEERLQEIVDRFNKSSKIGNIRLARLASGAPMAPLNLVRRYEMDHVLRAPGKFIPLHQMMSSAKEALNVKDLSEDIKAGVVDEKGRLVGLPVAYSTPVLFYNKNAFRKAGLDPEQAPKTWFEMQGMLDKLQESGQACPYTTAWPTWVHIDNVSAVSGVPAMSDKGVLSFNGLPQVKHVAMMATWQKAKYFVSFGRGGEANQQFIEGKCAMITTDSWEHTAFRDAKGVELGVAPLPYHDDVYGGRKNTLADGASLWVGAGHPANQYKIAAKFVSFLLIPEMQIELARVYGQLPMTALARSALRARVLRDRDDTLKIAYASMQGNGAKPPVRVANIDAVRQIVDEELEAVWADRKPAKAALDTAVNRGNAVLAAKPLLKKAQPF